MAESDGDPAVMALLEGGASAALTPARSASTLGSSAITSSPVGTSPVVGTDMGRSLVILSRFGTHSPGIGSGLLRRLRVPSEPLERLSGSIAELLNVEPPGLVDDHVHLALDVLLQCGGAG